jgi:hypothetical protein
MSKQGKSSVEAADAARPTLSSPAPIWRRMCPEKVVIRHCFSSHSSSTENKTANTSMAYEGAEFRMTILLFATNYWKTTPDILSYLSHTLLPSTTPFSFAVLRPKVLLCALIGAAADDFHSPAWRRRSYFLGRMFGRRDTRHYQASDD